jgi:hypothetical protein
VNRTDLDSELQSQRVDNPELTQSLHTPRKRQRQRQSQSQQPTADPTHGSYSELAGVCQSAEQSISCMTPNSRTRSIASSRPFVILYVRIHTPSNRGQHVAPGQWVQAPGCGRQLCAGWNSQAMPNGERVAVQYSSFPPSLDPSCCPRHPARQRLTMFLFSTSSQEKQE